MLRMGRGGIARVEGTAAFAPQTERLIGNAPGWTGSAGDTPTRRGPAPRGQVAAGNLGNYDGYSGTDPARAAIQPHPRRVFLSPMQETDRRWGIQGFNDQRQYRDRHVYWDRGRTAYRGPASNQTGGGANPNDGGPARADLRAVNISVNPQIGSDATRNADDLSRPYTWLGQQDGTTQAVYGGVPGLWTAYGNRGMPDGIHDPTSGDGGPEKIYGGPPHGYHSDTIPSGKQMADRYRATPQMRPVRLDRPSNSKIAGQSYSQTVLPQGATAPAGGGHGRGGVSFRVRARGWAGERK